MDVTDPITFSYLDHGHYDNDYKLINIRESAIEDGQLFAKVKLLADRPIAATIRFTDIYGNYIQLATAEKRVTVNYIDTRDNGNWGFNDFPTLADLPVDYVEYDIHYSSELHTLKDEAEIMTKWTMAKKITVRFDDSSKRGDFFRKVSQMRKAGQLENFTWE